MSTNYSFYSLANGNNSNKQKTQYQLNLQQPVEEKWYKGDQPTTREVMGRMFQISQSDPELGNNIQNTFNALMQDSTSVYYMPYLQPTNKAIGILNELGVDTTGIGEDWFRQNSYMRGYQLNTGTTNAVSSPGKNATVEQQIGYQFNQAEKANDLTQKAKTEWAAMKEEINYLANDPARNYSDDEIINKIYKDYEKKYPTLFAMDESLRPGSGKPLLELNEGIDYSRDSAYAAVWAARNNGGTGNLWKDMANSALGYGNVWQEDPEIAKKLTFNSGEYNPYEVSATAENVGAYYNMYSFPVGWFDSHKPTGEDETENKMWTIGKKADDFTVAAETELAEANEWLANNLQGIESEEAAKKVLEKFDKKRDKEWPSLKKIDESLNAPENIIPTTRPIDYSRNDVAQRIAETCEINASALTTDQTIEKYTGEQQPAQNAEAKKARDENLINSKIALLDYLTGMEQSVFSNAPKLIAGTIADALITIDPIKLMEANEAASTSKYTSQVTVLGAKVAENKEAQEELDKIVNYNNEVLSTLDALRKDWKDGFRNGGLTAVQELWDGEYNTTQGPDNALRTLYTVVTGDELGDKEDAIKFAGAFYDYIVGTIDSMSEDGEAPWVLPSLNDAKNRLERTIEETSDAEREYNRLNELWNKKIALYDSIGIDSTGLKTAQIASQVLSQFANYEAIESNSKGTYEQVAEKAKNLQLDVWSTIDSEHDKARKDLENAKWLKEYIYDVMVNVPAEYVDNLNRYIEKLEHDESDYNYLKIRKEEDYHKEAMAGRTKELNERLLPPAPIDIIRSGSPVHWYDDPIKYGLECVVIGYGANAIPADELMTQDEKDTFYYLYETQGFDSAKEYYDHLSGKFGVLNARHRERTEEEAANEVNSGLVGGTIANIKAMASAPFDAIGGLTYFIDRIVSGEEFDENNPLLASGRWSQSVNQATVNAIQNALPEGPLQDVVKGLYEIVYNRARSGANMVFGSPGGKFNDVVKEIIGAFPMALGAGALAVADAKGKKLDDTSAMIVGLVTIAMEDLTEGFTRSNIRSALRGGDEVAKRSVSEYIYNWLTSSGIEEMIGETGTDLVEQKIDELLAKENSDHNALVEKWAAELDLDLSDPVQRQRAEDLADQDEIGSLVHTAIISYLSPGLDVITGSLKNSIEDYHNIRVEARKLRDKNADVSMSDVREQYKAWKERKNAAIEEEEKNKRVNAVQPKDPTQYQQDYAQAEQEKQAAQKEQAEQAAQNNPSEGQRQMSKGDHILIDQLNLLESTQGSDSSTQVDAIGSLFGGEKNTPENDVSRAAASSMTNLFNSISDAVTNIWNFMMGARDDESRAAMLQALKTAALSKSSAAAQVVKSDEFSNATSVEEQVDMLAATVEQDQQNEEVTKEVANSTLEYRIAAAEAEIVKNTPAEQSIKADEEVSKRHSETISAEDALGEAQNVKDAKLEAAQAATNSVTQNPADKDAGKRQADALTDLEGAVVAESQAEDHLEKTQKAEADAEAKAAEIKQKEAASIREQAEAAVAQEDQQRAEAAAKQAEEDKARAEMEQQIVEAAREVSNFSKLDAEEFVDTNFPNISAEDRKYALGVFQEVQSAMSNTVDAVFARKGFAEKFAKKFGLEWTSVDSTGGDPNKAPMFNAYIMPGTNKLVVDRSASTNDIMYAVLIHELTHTTESGKGSGTESQEYYDLADAVLRLRYGEDVSFKNVLEQIENGDYSSKIAQDVLARKDQYEKFFADQGDEESRKAVTFKYALQEIVADRVGYTISSDQEALNNLVQEQPSLARRILAAIKSFLKKVVGMEGETITQAQNVVNLLENALKEAENAPENKTKFNLSSPVEVLNNGLVATHSLKYRDLLSMEKFNGMPAPSMAVSQTGKGFGSGFYGPITFVFNKSSIDPKSNPDNKLFGRDSWTPTFPRTKKGLLGGERFVETGEKVTAEGAVDLMKNQQMKNGIYGNAFMDAETPDIDNNSSLLRHISAEFSKDYSTIDDLAADRERFGTRSVPELQAELNSYSDQIDALKKDIISDIMESGKRDLDLVYDDRKSGDAQEVILAFRLANQNPESAKNSLGLKDETIQRILDLTKEIQQTHANYAEAKPMRVVGWGEIAAAFVPLDAPKDVVKFLTDRGIPVEGYSDNADRASAINNSFAVKNARFSLQQPQINHISKAQAKAIQDSYPSSAVKVSQNHTTEQIKTVESYLGSVDQRLVNAAKTLQADNKTWIDPIALNVAGERETTDIFEKTGEDVSGYTHTVDRNFFNHVEKRHGANGRHDQTMSDINDISRVGWVINNYDSLDLIKDGEDDDGIGKTTIAYKKTGNVPMQIIKYTKQIDGTLYVAEAVGENEKKQLHIMSAYMQKNNPAKYSLGNAASRVADVSSLSLNVQDGHGSPADKMLTQESANVNTIAKNNRGEDVAIEMPGGTVYVAPETKFSLSSFNKNEQKEVRDALINSGRFTRAQVDRYMKDALGIASVIAADRQRLDFEASDNQVFLKPNNDYYFTLDASTLCAKRLLYQGTFDYVQHALPDEVFTPEDLIDLVNIMNDMGYETPCGICYVESRRRWLDTYAQKFLDELPEDADGFIEKYFTKAKEEDKAAIREHYAEWHPSIDDLTTSDGLEKLRHDNPYMHKAFVDAMNKKGTANPKVVQLRTEYRGDIRNMTAKDIQKVKDIGGLRIQSFSDFETPHLLDMMQAVLDMSAAGLTSQAYTKVPNFAWVFGDTGIKINLSLIGKGTGLDENGNLVFDNREGMNFDEAMKIRERYGKNVGTILVGINDDHIIAAMGDPRIDFIIPFHKSGWSAEELRKMPTLNNYNDYTDTQNERLIIGRKEDGSYETESFKKHKDRTKESLENFQPVGKNGYWNFNKSGQWNAEKYLKMCAKANRVPKFSQFLVDNGDGSFSLPQGDDKRSTAIREGYWKTLIDFKMYENDAYGRTREDGTKTEVKGSKQKEVTPNINMAEAYRVMNEYQLGRQMPDKADGTPGRFIPMENNNSVPVAVPAAEEYIELIKRKREGVKPTAPSPYKLEADLPADASANNWVNPRASVFGASQAPAVLGNTEGSTEDVASAKQSAMAIDAETGETVRYSLPAAIDSAFDDMSADELSQLLGLGSDSTEEETKNVMTVAVKDIRDEFDPTIYNGKLYVKPDTLDLWLSGSGFASTNPDYAQAYITTMDPADFLRMTTVSENGQNKILNEATPLDTEKLEENGKRQPIHLLIDEETGKITGHEGRHRAVALSRAGVTEIPVLLFDSATKYSKTPKEQMTLEGQDFYDNVNGNTITFADVLPLAGRYRDEIEQRFLASPEDEANAEANGQRVIRYSLPSDAPYLNAVNRGDMETAQKMVDEKSDEAGYVKDAFHGTLNGGYTIFDKQKAHIGGNSGAGFYFSSNQDDSEANYSDVEGADNHFKVEHLAEKIQEYISETGENEYAGVQIPEDASYEDIEEIAKQMLQGNPMTYHVRLNPGKAYIRDFNNSTNLLEEVYEGFDESAYDRNDFDSDDEYEDAIIEGRSDYIYEAISSAVYEGIADVDSNFEIISNVDYESIISALAMQAMDYESLTWNDVMKVISDQYIDAIVGDGEESADASTEITRAIVEAFGFDSIEDREVSKKFNQLKNMGAGGTVHYIMFRPDQIKLADPVTYDNDGNVIPLSSRFKKTNNDIRYSLPSDDVLRRKIEQYLTTGNTLSTQDNLPGMPTAEGGAQRQFGSQTAQASDALHEEVKQYLYTHSDYTPETNSQQIDRALDWVQGHANENDPDGYRAAVDEVTGPDFDFRSADGQARMLTVMGMAALKGDTSTETRIADAYNEQGTELGRALQARQIFRLMTPIGRRMALQRETARINQDFRNTGSDIEVHLSEWVLHAAEVAETEEDYQKVQRAAEKELAEQMPANWKDKLRTWRMLSMLANPRTHIRNIIGNAIFKPTVSLKNAIGAGLESAFIKGDGERTKAVRFTDDAKAFAAEDVKAMKDVLTGEAKYSPEGRIEQEKKAFGQGKGLLSRTVGKGVQALADFNSDLLEKEDWIFLNNHYQTALASYMTANGLKSSDMTGETLQKARTYAVLEAQKATYRDANSVSSWLNKASREGGVKGFLVDAVLPFKKTPANILRRGIEYSPVGLLHSLATAKKSLDLYAAWEQNGRKGTMPKGAKSATQVLDGIASGLTGTAISALGALAYALGAVKLSFGGEPDDELEQERGSQEYSIELFGHSFTIDWAAPVCMPFFTGASLWKTITDQNEKADFGAFVDSLMQITEPVFNLSMLDGVNSLLSSIKYSSNSNKLPVNELLQKIGANYVGSVLGPSALGAVARTVDTTRRKNYVPSGASMSIWQGMLEQVQNKIPFLSMNNIPYRNVWGEADESSRAEAFLENFVLPGYVNQMSESKLDTELQRLYDAGQDSVIPKTAAKTVGGVKLDAEQYDQYVTTRGQTAKTLLEDLIERPEYIALTNENPEAQAQLMKDVWEYANATARYELFPDYKMDKWIAGAYAGGNVIDAIFDREEGKAKTAYITDKNTELYASIDGQDADAISACVEGLKQAGKDDKSIRTTVMNHYRDAYKEAYLADDTNIMEAIRYGLMYLDLGDYSIGDDVFDKWEQDATDKLENSNKSSRNFNPRTLMASASGIPSGYADRVNDTTGQYGKGNIDLNNRQVVYNDDGSISTELSFSFYDEDTGKEVLIPTVINGKIVSEDEAINYYYETGEYLGMFDTVEEAEEYAEMLHNRQEWYYNR